MSELPTNPAGPPPPAEPPPRHALLRHLDLLSLLLLGATALWLRRHWDEVPDPFPIHWGPQGADRFVARTDADAYRPLVVGLVLILLVAAFRRMILLLARVKGGNAPRAVAGRELIGDLFSAAAWFFGLVLSAGTLTPILNDPHVVARAAVAGAVLVGLVLAWGLLRLARTPREPEGRS